MKKFILLLALASSPLWKAPLMAHCQMPCGIYNDQMVYDKIDEYYATMMKAVSAMKDLKFDNLHDKNQFIRWVITKEDQCNEIITVITNYFLLQKIPPSEDSVPLLRSAHKMLFLAMQIKQHADADIVKQFNAEWEHFKTLFHPDNKCREGIPPINSEPKNQKEVKKEVQANDKKEISKDPKNAP